MKHDVSPRTSVERAALGRNGGAIQVVMNTMFVRHLVSVYRAFGGDLVAAIVLGEVAHHNLTPLIGAAHTPREVGEALRGKGRSLPRTFVPTNSFSIAQATGIPRETVRRKVASLTRRGWLAKDADGNLFVEAVAETEFTAFTVQRLNDLLETSEAIQSLLPDRQPTTRSRRQQNPKNSGRGGPPRESS
jgi:alkylated DNA nucleotide flippase Atl1